MFTASLALFACCENAQTADTKPNIVLILTDNPGYGEIGCYGDGLTGGATRPRQFCGFFTLRVTTYRGVIDDFYVTRTHRRMDYPA